MRTKIAAVLISTVVLGGGAVAYAQDDVESPQGAGVEWLRQLGGDILQGVLDDLVADGVITADQAEAIVAALEAKRDELREGVELFRSFWEDGVLTSEEIAQLPTPNPFTDPQGELAEALEDGELTRAELEAIRGARGQHRGELRGMVGQFLSDGVLTADEIAQLPEPNPFGEDGPFAEALEDGQITREELLSVWPRRHHPDGGDTPGT